MKRDLKPTLSKSKISTLMKDLRGGRSVSLQFLKDNGWILALIMVTVLSLMGLRYKTKTRMIEIKRLNIELQRAESEKLKEKQEYMTLIRQTRMNELVRENNLGLIHQEQPPFEIDADTPASPASPTKTDTEDEQEN